MAIQNRRGKYSDFDKSKMLPGEWAVVTGGDTESSDGKSVYMAFASGDVKRMATYEDMQDNISEITDDIADDLVERVEAELTDTVIQHVEDEIYNQLLDDTVTSTSKNPVRSSGIYTALDKKVDKVSGKGLSTNDYTTAEKNKLSGIAAGSQVNVIETVKINGTALTPANKAVDVTVPTKTSDLTNDSDFISNSTLEALGLKVVGGKLCAVYNG